MLIKRQIVQDGEIFWYLVVSIEDAYSHVPDGCSFDIVDARSAYVVRFLVPR